MNKEEYAKFVRAERDRLSISLRSFAEKLDISWMTVFKWENQVHMPKQDALKFWIDKIRAL